MERLQERELLAADLVQTPSVEVDSPSSVMNGTEVSLVGKEVVIDSTLAGADVDVDANGVIRVIGTQGDDLVLIEPHNDGRITVQVNDQQHTLQSNSPVRVFTGAGEDQVVVRGGHPVLVDAGSGDDLVLGGDGDDRLFGGPGNDRILGGGGYDLVDGGGGDDTLAGGTEDDVLGGGLGDDRIDGGDGDDRLVGGSGSDTLIGSTGDDMLLATSGKRDCVFRDWTRINEEWQNTSNWIACPSIASDEDHDILIGGEGNDVGSLAPEEGDVAVDVEETSQHIEVIGRESAIEHDTPTSSFDVNRDGSVDDGDVRAIIRQLNLNLNLNPRTSAPAEGEALAQYDVSGDEIVSPLDVLQIINHLNTISKDAGEVEVTHDVLRALPGENDLAVDRSGTVAPDDVELIFEELENNGSGQTSPVTEHLDANKDGYVSPADALAVINELERDDASLHRDFIAAIDDLFAAQDELDELTGSLSADLF